MLFGGWAREDAEEELWYIKKHGLELGEVMYKEYLKEEERIAILNRVNPEPVLWSDTEPKVTKYDIIATWDETEHKVIDEFRIIRIENGKIICKQTIPHNNCCIINNGKEFVWNDKIPYRKLCSAQNK